MEVDLNNYSAEPRSDDDEEKNQHQDQNALPLDDGEEDRSDDEIFMVSPEFRSRVSEGLMSVQAAMLSSSTCPLDFFVPLGKIPYENFRCSVTLILVESHCFRSA